MPIDAAKENGHQENNPASEKTLIFSNEKEKLGSVESVRSNELQVLWTHCRYLVQELLVLILQTFAAIFAFIIHRIKHKEIIYSDLSRLKGQFSAIFGSSFASRSPAVPNEKYAIESQVSMCELLLPSQVDPRGIYNVIFIRLLICI